MEQFLLPLRGNGATRYDRNTTIWRILGHVEWECILLRTLNHYGVPCLLVQQSPQYLIDYIKLGTQSRSDMEIIGVNVSKIRGEA